MVKLSATLRLLRWPNLLIIALVQYLIRFAITESLNIPHVLTRLEYTLGVLCSISLAGAGYIINDLFDKGTDQRNKPGRMVIGRYLSSGNAWVIYGLLNLLAIGSGYLVARAAGFEDLWLIPVVAIALLYLYSVDLKKRAVLGNLIVSFLVGLPIFFTAVFDILPAGTPENSSLIKPIFNVILAYAGFAVFTNFIRELIKDAEDLEGDEAEGYRTLAVLLGRNQVRYVILALLFVLLIFTGAYDLYLFETGTNLFSALYVGIFVILPILYLIWKILTARSKLDFKKASILMKIIMITGILSMVVFTLVLKL